MNADQKKKKKKGSVDHDEKSPVKRGIEEEKGDYSEKCLSVGGSGTQSTWRGDFCWREKSCGNLGCQIPQGDAEREPTQ